MIYKRGPLLILILNFENSLSSFYPFTDKLCCLGDFNLKALDILNLACLRVSTFWKRLTVSK